MSESVAKALRGGIGGEKKRVISTILLRCSGSIRAFATDLDNLRRRGPGRGATGRPATTTGAPTGRTGDLNQDRDWAGPSRPNYVELGGFEPPTSSMPWKRATNCAIAPKGDRHRLAPGGWWS